MEPTPTTTYTSTEQVENEYQLATWVRIYLHGILAFVVLFALAYLVTRIMPVFELAGSPFLAFLLSALCILVAPPLVGCLILYGIFPLMGMKQGWRDVTGWDQRLFAQVSSVRNEVQIVIINWPTKEVRTMGALTSTFTTPGSSRPLAAVYVPTAPNTKFGYIQVVPLDDVEVTDLTFKEWQLYQLTLGSAIPKRLRSDTISQ